MSPSLPKPSSLHLSRLPQRNRTMRRGAAAGALAESFYPSPAPTLSPSTSSTQELSSAVRAEESFSEETAQAPTIDPSFLLELSSLVEHWNVNDSPISGLAFDFHNAPTPPLPPRSDSPFDINLNLGADDGDDEDDDDAPQPPAGGAAVTVSSAAVLSDELHQQLRRTMLRRPLFEDVTNADDFVEKPTFDPSQRPPGTFRPLSATDGSSLEEYYVRLVTQQTTPKARGYVRDLITVEGNRRGNRYLLERVKRMKGRTEEEKRKEQGLMKQLEEENTKVAALEKVKAEKEAQKAAQDAQLAARNARLAKQMQTTFPGRKSGKIMTPSQLGSSSSRKPLPTCLVDASLATADVTFAASPSPSSGRTSLAEQGLEAFKQQEQS
ncbi:unnamed protein product [Peniophora sp. CBMAI 1063]|nr:unnamed protein product [Peniophora sp. CBMAI 1063]